MGSNGFDVKGDSDGFDVQGDSDGFNVFADRLNYPMFVLTVPGAGAEPASGCLVGFATQCSIDPARFLVCVSRNNHTYRAIRGATFVGLHLLGEDDRDLAKLFGTESGDSVDKFARCRWTPRHAGVPVLDDCVVWFVAVIRRSVELGDHVGFLVEPVQVGQGQGGEPMMLAAVEDLDAGHAA